MIRKTLPKVIVRTSDEGQRAKIADDAPQPKRRSTAEPKSAPNEPVPAPHATLLQGAAEGVSAPEILPPPHAGASPSAESSHAAPNNVQRRARAQKIVDRHKVYAAMGGLFPLPVINIAGLTAINARMVKALSELYGVPFERDRTRSIIMALLAGAVPSGLAAATASTLAFIFPASGLFGLAVSSVSAAAVTRGIGLVFVEHFESGAA